MADLRRNMQPVLTGRVEGLEEGRLIRVFELGEVAPHSFEYGGTPASGTRRRNVSGEDSANSLAEFEGVRRPLAHRLDPVALASSTRRRRATRPRLGRRGSDGFILLPRPRSSPVSGSSLSTRPAAPTAAAALTANGRCSVRIIPERASDAARPKAFSNSRTFPAVKARSSSAPRSSWRQSPASGTAQRSARCSSGILIVTRVVTASSLSQTDSP